MDVIKSVVVIENYSDPDLHEEMTREQFYNSS